MQNINHMFGNCFSKTFLIKLFGLFNNKIICESCILKNSFYYQKNNNLIIKNNYLE